MLGVGWLVFSGKIQPKNKGGKEIDTVKVERKN